MFFILRKKTILVAIIVLLIFVSSVGVYYGVKIVVARPNLMPIVVIDAGHGGIDGGSVGKLTGVCESNLNLIYAKNLENQLKQMNISCVLTRSDDSGLYDKNAKNLKRSDMLARKKIIEKYSPTIVISIHMNSFVTSSAKGAQVFYKKDNEQGKILADCVQSQLFLNIDNAKKTSKVGDYYIVNCTDIPAILVECGYLSNNEEEFLLQNEDYQNKVCYSILCGIVSYLNNGGF